MFTVLIIDQKPKMKYFFTGCALCCFYIFQAQELPYQSLVVNKSLTDNADAIVRLDDFVVNLQSHKEMSIQYKRVVTVLNKDGNKLVNAYVFYDKNVTIKELEARIFDIAGNELSKIKRKDFKDVSAVDGGTLYSDSRVLYLDYTPIKYPYTVELRYEYKTLNTAFIPLWYPLDAYNLSVEHSQYTITEGAGVTIRTKEIGLEGFNSIEKESVGTTLRYTAKNLPATKKEDYSPPLNEFAPHVLFAGNKFNLEGVEGTATDWVSMGKWQYDNLLMNKDMLPEQTKLQMLTKVAGITDPLEKARIVYKYVQDHTRYISVQVGIGGWMPIDAATVDKVKYGDCKGLTNYTKALLKEVGVEAYYAVVYAGREKRGIDPEFASMQGNHVILNIPTAHGDTWLECTSQTMPFGFLGDFTDDRNVLVLTPEGGKIKRTPLYKEEENRQSTTSQLQIDGKGTLTGQVVVTSQGLQYDNRFHLSKSSKDEVIKHYKSYWNYLNNLTINEYALRNDAQKISFGEEVQLSATGYASMSGDRLIFSPNILNRNTSMPDKYKERLSPLKINRGYFDEDEFVIALPEGFTIEALPKNTSLQTPFGTYSFEIIQNENHSVTYKRKMLLKEGSFSNTAYDEFRDFIKETNKQDNSKIVLIKKAT